MRSLFTLCLNVAIVASLIATASPSAAHAQDLTGPFKLYNYAEGVDLCVGWKQKIGPDGQRGKYIVMQKCANAAKWYLYWNGDDDSDGVVIYLDDGTFSQCIAARSGAEGAAIYLSASGCSTARRSLWITQNSSLEGTQFRSALGAGNVLSIIGHATTAGSDLTLENQNTVGYFGKWYATWAG